MITILQCLTCLTGYEYYGPDLKSNPLIYCESCNKDTRAKPYKLLHQDDAVFEPIPPEIPKPTRKVVFKFDKTQKSLQGVIKRHGVLRTPIPEFSETEKAVFQAYLKPVKGKDCLEFKGTVDSSGYGRFSLYGQVYVATRVAWRIYHNMDPGNKTVGTTCGNPLCCYGPHLERKKAGKPRGLLNDKQRK